MRIYTCGVEEMPTTKVEAGGGGRLPSIEMEPRTLTVDRIKYAREAALYVVSTKTEEEAIRIFTAGLKPVQTETVRNNKSSSIDSSDDDVDLEGGRCCSKGGRRPSFMDDDIRDVATAPF